jgi:tRNA1Val (adenine37-N6)-methyltransferase
MMSSRGAGGARAMVSREGEHEGDLVRPYERVDDLQRSGLVIIQNPVRFRFSVDAVLLSEFVSAREGDRVIDLGTGTGVIPLLVWARRRPAKLVGVEIMEDMADMAWRSVRLNRLEQHISIVHDDLRNAPARFGLESFDVVTANPPYMKAGAGVLPGEHNVGKSEAKHELACTLDDVVRTASALLRSRGKLAMVHRPARLVDLVCAMRAAGLEPRRARFVQSRAKSSPVMVLVEAVKNVKPDLTILPTLNIYGDDGQYTEEMMRIYTE